MQIKSIIFYICVIALLLFVQNSYLTNIYDKKIEKCKIELVVGKSMSDISAVLKREESIERGEIDDIISQDAIGIYLDFSFLMHFAKKEPNLIEEGILVNYYFFCRDIKSSGIIELVEENFLKSKLSNKAKQENIQKFKEDIEFFRKQCIKIHNKIK